jgi:hypothetical protein
MTKFFHATASATTKIFHRVRRRRRNFFATHAERDVTTATKNFSRDDQRDATMATKTFSSCAMTTQKFFARQQTRRAAVENFSRAGHADDVKSAKKIHAPLSPPLNDPKNFSHGRERDATMATKTFRRDAMSDDKNFSPHAPTMTKIFLTT